MLKPAFILTVVTCLLASAPGRQPEKKPDQQQDQPKMKINVLNVCTPPTEEQTEIKNAFARVSGKPAFSHDFEVSRGQATMQNQPESKFVRLRRDMASESPLLAAQYSMSTDAANTIETLVLRMRDPKQFHELSLEDRISTGAASPSTVLSVDTPVTRIRLERFSKNSIVLTRCPEVDQSAYEPLFSQASNLMSQYRRALGLRDTFRSDINWLNGSEAKKPATNGTQKKGGATRKK